MKIHIHLKNEGCKSSTEERKFTKKKKKHRKFYCQFKLGIDCFIEFRNGMSRERNNIEKKANDLKNTLFPIDILSEYGFIGKKNFYY